MRDGSELGVLGQVDGIGGPHDVEGGARFLSRGCWSFFLAWGSGAEKSKGGGETKQKLINN